MSVRFGTLAWLLAAVSFGALDGCSSAQADQPSPTVEPATTLTVPAPATAEAIGLDAPHSGDVPAGGACPSGTEMLDWDGDGWGDCVSPAAPPTITPP